MTETAGGTREGAHNLPVLTVTQVSLALQRVVEESFGRVRVRGEVSGFKRHASGHLYLSLKDSEALIEAVCWRLTAQHLRFMPQDGLEVICTGRITTYPGRSKYQIVIESLEPAGIGALMALLEQRRRRLAAEGLFAAARKKPLPHLPDVIGVVTSESGAVIRDILHRLRERFPRHVLVWPVPVQGEGAAERIAAAIAGFNRLLPGDPVPRPDVLIVARGGGSIEDLWAFNEEAVVRAAAASAIPLIAAVGHETDTTLIDFAADRRAPTPSAAAEMAVPVRSELWVDVGGARQRLTGVLTRHFAALAAELRSARRGVRDPRAAIEGAAQRLDELGGRLGRALRIGHEQRRAGFAQLAQRLTPAAITRRIERAAAALGQVSRLLEHDLRRHVAEASLPLAALRGRLRPLVLTRLVTDGERRLTVLGTVLGRSLARGLDDRDSRLAAQAKLLSSLSYRSVLERGFAVVRDDRQRPITSLRGIRAGMPIAVEFRDGAVDATASGAASSTPPRPRKPSGPGGQGSLF